MILVIKRVVSIKRDNLPTSLTGFPPVVAGLTKSVTPNFFAALLQKKLLKYNNIYV